MTGDDQLVDVGGLTPSVRRRQRCSSLTGPPSIAPAVSISQAAPATPDSPDSQLVRTRPVLSGSYKSHSFNST